MKKWMTLFVAVALCGACAGNAAAWDLTGFGGKVGYESPQGLDGTAAIAAHAEFQKYDSALHIVPSLGYWNSNDVRDVNPNLDLTYHFASDSRIIPYLGAGLGLHFLRNDGFDDNSTDLGLNLLGGLRFPGGATTPFMEMRYTLSDVDQFAFLGGITLHTH